MTEIVPASDPRAIARAVEVLRAGGLVAFPTETVYGLGADATNAQAVARVFAIKNRPRFDPLIVHVDRVEATGRVARLAHPLVSRLAERFWPGPLTLVLPKQPDLPELVTAGLPSVAVRIPSHPVAQGLLAAVDTPIAAPSANPFGYVSPTTAEHVREGLENQIDLILDGGPCAIGVESTVLDLTGAVPQVLRYGAISVEELAVIVTPIGIRLRGAETPLSPGQLDRHYATRTPLTLLSDAETGPPGPGRYGLLAWRSPGSTAAYAAVEVLSSRGDPTEAAQNLFAALRRLDRLGLDRLYAEPCPARGLGAAIMDRLRRAAVPQSVATSH